MRCTSILCVGDGAGIAAANAEIGESDVRDMLPEAIEKRFGICRAPEVIEALTDNGSV